MADERELRIKITGDASSLVSESQRGAEALSATGKELDKNSEQTEKAEFNQRKFARALSMVSPELGEVAHMAHLAEAGPLIALVVVIGVVTKALGEMQKKLEEVRQKQAEFSATVWENERKGAEEAAAATREFTEAINHQATAEEKLKGKFAEAKAVLDAMLQQREKLMEAMGIKESATTGEGAQLRLKQEELTATQHARDVAEDAYNTAAQRSMAADTVPSTVSLAQSEMKNVSLVDLMRRLRDIEDKPLPASGPGRAIEAEQREKHIEALKKEIDDYQQNAAVIQAYAQEQKRLKDETEKTKQAFEKLRERTSELEREVDTAGKVLGIHQHGEFQQAHAGEAMDIMNAAGGALGKRGGADLVQTVMSVAMSQSLSIQQSQAMLRTAATNVDSWNKLTEKFLDALEKMGANLPAFQARANKLEAQVRGSNTP